MNPVLVVFIPHPRGSLTVIIIYETVWSHLIPNKADETWAQTQKKKFKYGGKMMELMNHCLDLLVGDIPRLKSPVSGCQIPIIPNMSFLMEIR